MKTVGRHDWACKQSRFEHVPALPTRMLLAGPSGAGKGVTLQSLLLNHYRGCFARIYFFSPTVHLDRSTWDPVKDYVRKELHIDTDKEPCFFDEWDEGVLRTILSEHTKVIQLLKERKGKKHLPGIAVICDDFADSPEVTHNPRNVITSLFVRGRHSMVSIFISTQKLRAISTPVRVNATAYIVFPVAQSA